MFSTDSGTTWTNDAGLDSAMTGGGAFVYQNRRGPTAFTGFGGYPQPTLVAFDPQDPNILVAGGADFGRICQHRWRRQLVGHNGSDHIRNLGQTASAPSMVRALRP